MLFFLEAFAFDEIGQIINFGIKIGYDLGDVPAPNVGKTHNLNTPLRDQSFIYYNLLNLLVVYKLSPIYQPFPE